MTWVDPHFDDVADYDEYVSGIEDQLDRNEQHRETAHYETDEDVDE